MKRNILLICITLFMLLRIGAQPYTPEGDPGAVNKPGEIKGIIHDSTTQGPIEYATVGLYRLSDSSLVSGVVTNTGGTFAIRNVPAGEYYMDANFLGYSKKRISPLLLTTQRSALDLGVIGLHPDITHIAEVQVVAQGQRLEYRIDKKVVNVSQDISGSGGTLVNVLENTPSVEVDVEGNVSLRGSGNFQLLIDGKPSIIGGSDGLQQIPASAVQSLEIITSPSAKYDPDGNAGIINVIMKKQKNSGIGGIVNVSAGTGEKYTGDFLLNIKKQKLNYFIGGEYSDLQFHNRGERERRTYLADTTFYTLNTIRGVFARTSVNLKSGFDYSINDKTSISLSGVIGNRDSKRDFTSRGRWFTSPASSDSFYTENNISDENDRFYNLNLDYLKRFDQMEHNLQASVYFSASEEKETDEDVIKTTDFRFQPFDVDPARTRSRNENPEKELRVELDYTRPFKTGKIETGLQSRWDKDQATYIYEDFQPFGAEWMRNDSISNTMDYLDAIQSAYLIYSGPLGKIEYQVGLRAEYDNRQIDQKTSAESHTYEKFHFFPSFYLTRKFTEAHQLQFTYSRRIQRPRERDLNPFKEFRGANNVSYGNPSLTPEFTNAFELNYQYTFKIGFVSLETYYRGTTGKITRISGYDTLAGKPVFTSTSTNADRDYSLGAELMANLELTPWWQLNLTGNVFRYQLDGQVGEDKISSVSTTWRTNFNTSFKLKWDTRLQFTGVYNGPSNTLQGQRDGFFFANAALRKELFKKKLTVALNVRDIFATGVWSFTSEGEDFYSFNKSKREAPVVTLNLSYRLNNYRQTNNRRDGEGRSDSNGMEEML